MPVRIGIDLDGCLADFNRAYGDMLAKITGRDLLPINCWNDPAFPPVWFWERDLGYTKDEEEETWRAIEQSSSFWKRLWPLPDALESINLINKAVLDDDGEFYFITHRRGHACKRQTEEWLESHGCITPTVIVSGGDKTPTVTGLRLQAFVDDKLSTAIAVAEKCHVTKSYLLDAPWNRQDRPRGKGFRVVTKVSEMLAKELHDDREDQTEA